MALEKNLVNTIHPESNTNVWTRFYGNPSNSSGEILLKTTNVNLVSVLDKQSGHCQTCNSRCWDISLYKWKLQPADGAKGKVRKSPKSQRLIFWAPLMFVQSFVPMDPSVVEIFPKWWTKRQTEFSIVQKLHWYIPTFKQTVMTRGEHTFLFHVVVILPFFWHCLNQRKDFCWCACLTAKKQRRRNKKYCALLVESP